MAPRPLGPDPDVLHPVPEHPRLMFPKNIPGLVNVSIGDYTYYDDPAGPDAFRRNILYHFPFNHDRLIIGKFCCIATGAKFIMNGANHRLDGLTTYPFPIFGHGWSGVFAGEMDFPKRGDTVIGNDVWLGYDCLIMPGIKIGDGAIVGSRAVVTKDVGAYEIVAGNPARVIRKRFSEGAVERLLRLRWWDWEVEKIVRHIKVLSAGREEELARLE